MRFLLLLALFTTFIYPQKEVDELTTKIDSYLTSIEKDGFSGAVLLEAGNKIALKKGYGKSCNKGNITPDMVFDLGSITKIITATATLTLVIQDKIALSDTLGKFIINVPPDKSIITIQQLLTHTSGLQDSFGKDETWIDKESLVDTVMKSELQFDPGADQVYSNAGYSVLGYIIEEVTAGSYEDYIKNVIFNPLGITKTGYMLPDWKKENIVCGIMDGENWGSVKDYYGPTEPSWYLFANGGMLSTLHDLNLFFKSLIGEKILNKSLTELIVSSITHRIKKNNRRLVSFSGANYIFSSLYLNWLDGNVVMILFTNNSDWPKEKVYPSMLPIVDHYIDQIEGIK